MTRRFILFSATLLSLPLAAFAAGSATTLQEQLAVGTAQAILAIVCVSQAYAIVRLFAKTESMYSKFEELLRQNISTLNGVEKEMSMCRERQVGKK